MEFPLKAFEIKNSDGSILSIEIAEIFGFPDETSFRGGYDIRCNLIISSGRICVDTDSYYSSTGALFVFYTKLKNCYDELKGSAEYRVYCPDGSDLTFTVSFDGGKVNVKGVYKDDTVESNFFSFSFTSDQSYFKEVLRDLKKVINIFGDNRGKAE